MTDDLITRLIVKYKDSILAKEAADRIAALEAQLAAATAGRVTGDLKPLRIVRVRTNEPPPDGWAVDMTMGGYVTYTWDSGKSMSGYLNVENGLRRWANDRVATPADPVAEAARVHYELHWIAAARPPMHPTAMNGRQSFDTADEVVCFWRDQPGDATFIRLDMVQTLRTPVTLRAITEGSHE